MPNKDEIQLIGKCKCIWKICPECEGGRWVHLVNGRARSKLCKSCAGKHRPLPIWNYFKSGKDNIAWKGGIRHDAAGYIQIRVYPESPFATMANVVGYISEHRLVMAQHLGRCLNQQEIVHHKDRNKHNNILSNLELSDSKHHYPIRHYIDRIKELETEIARLKNIRPDKQSIKLEET